MDDIRHGVTKASVSTPLKIAPPRPIVDDCPTPAEKKSISNRTVNEFEFKPLTIDAVVSPFYKLTTIHL